MLGQMFSGPTWCSNSAWRMSLGGLLACTAEDERAAGVVDLVGEPFECLEAGGVDGGHVAQAQDDDVRERSAMSRDVIELFGAAEEERAVNAEDGDVVGNLAALKDVQRPSRCLRW